MASGDWTDQQNDAIVANYFAMLAEDEAGRPYSKAEHNRRLQEAIGRPRGSIEYKHQNIRVVVARAGNAGPMDRPAAHAGQCAAAGRTRTDAAYRPALRRGGA
jgi:hypothetical protein